MPDPTDLLPRSAAEAVGPIRIADGLGVASVALGLPMLLAPTRFPRWIGLRADRRAALLTAGVGVRELAATATILGMRHRRVGAWSRVAGDTLDLLMLARSFPGRRERTGRLIGATAFVAGILAADLTTALALDRADGARVPDGATSHGGGAKTPPAPAGPAAAITVQGAEQDVRRALVSFPFSAFEAGELEREGGLRLVAAPGGRGTEIHVRGGDHARVREELRRFKARFETGVDIVSDKTPEPFSSVRQLLQRPAQPAEVAR